MALVCPTFHLTWYDGLWPSESGELSLLGEGDWVDEGSALNGQLTQIVQEAEYPRGEVPDFWVRGSRRTPLEWTQVIPEIANDGQAIALAMDAAASMPSGTGWILLDLPNVGRRWVIAPAAVASLGWTHMPLKNELHLRWGIKKGVPSEIAIEAEPYAWLWEDGTEILWPDGTFVAQEDAV